MSSLICVVANGQDHICNGMAVYYTENYSLKDLAFLFSTIFCFLCFAIAFADSEPDSCSSCKRRKTLDEFVHFVFFPSSGLKSASLFLFGFLNFISNPAFFRAL